jgi:hypothetical protein
MGGFFKAAPYGCGFFTQVSKGLESMMKTCFTKVYLGGDHSNLKQMLEGIKYVIPDLKKHQAIAIIGNKPHYIDLFKPPKIDPPKKFNFLRDAWIPA